MTEVLKKLTVDLSRKGGPRPIFAVENDTGARKLNIKITDDGSPYKLDVGTVAILNYKRADGVSGAVLAEIEDDGVLVTLNSLILGAPGQVICSVSLTDEDKNKITGSEFCLDVGEELYSGETLDTAPEYGILLDTLSRLSEIEKAESARVIAEEGREAAREAFESEINAKISRQDGDIASKFAEQDATIESRLAEQDAAISKHDDDIASKFAEQDAAISKHDDDIASKFAEQDAAISKHDGDIASKFAEQDATIESRLAEQDAAISKHDDDIASKFAEQDGKLSAWYKQVHEAFQLQNAAISKHDGNIESKFAEQDVTIESRLAAQDDKISEVYEAFENGKKEIGSIGVALDYIMHIQNVFIRGFSEGLDLRRYGNGYAVVGMGTCTDEHIVIPKEYNGFSVDTIESLHSDNIKSVFIPSSVKVIEVGAFYECSDLKSVHISEGVTYLGASAFYGCTSLVSVNIPDSLPSIGEGAFYGCSSLRKIVLGKGIEWINGEVFESCYNLTDIYVPWSEGEVPYAPWGATNATIYYNSEV